MRGLFGKDGQQGFASGPRQPISGLADLEERRRGVAWYLDGMRDVTGDGGRGKSDAFAV